MGIRISRADARRLGLVARAAPSKTKGEMNWTEKEWAFQLEVRRRNGEIRVWAYEADTLDLAPKCTYTPDFKVTENDDTITYYEVKGGHVWDDAIVKLKVASRLYPDRRFILARKRRGTWKLTCIPAG